MNYGQDSTVDINTNQHAASPPRSPTWFIYERGFTRASQTVEHPLPSERSISPGWFIYEPGFTRASQADRHDPGQAAMSSPSESLPGSSPDAQVTPAFNEIVWDAGSRRALDEVLATADQPHVIVGREGRPWTPGRTDYSAILARLGVYETEVALLPSPENQGAGASNASGSRESPSPVGASSSPAYSPNSWPGRSSPDVSRTRPLSSASYGNPEPSWRFRGYPTALSPSPEPTPKVESNFRPRRDSDDASPRQPWERSYLPDPFPAYSDMPQIVRDHCLLASKEYLQRQRDQWLRIFRPTHHDWEDETLPIVSSHPTVAFRYVIGGRTVTKYKSGDDHAPYLYFPEDRDSIATPPPEPPAPTDSFVTNIRLIADLVWRRMLHRNYPNGLVDSSLTEIDTLDTVAWRAREISNRVEAWLAGGYLDPEVQERWERMRAQRRSYWERLELEGSDCEKEDLTMEEQCAWDKDQIDRQWMLKALREQIDAGRDICYLLGATDSALMLCDLSTEAHERCPWIRDEDFKWYYTHRPTEDHPRMPKGWEFKGRVWRGNYGVTASLRDPNDCYCY